MRRHVGGPFTPPRRASSGSYPDSRAGARRAPTSSSDDAGAAVKASVGGPSDLDAPSDASEDDDARASLRDVDIGAREETGERVRVLDDERADADSETDAHEEREESLDHTTAEDRRDGDDDDEEEEREEEESASDGGDSLADHSSADTSLNALDPDNLRVLQSYGLRPQMSYESSENETGSDDNLLDDDDVRAAISASLRLSRRLGESREFSRAAAGLGRRSDDEDDEDDESSSEEEEDDESSSEEEEYDDGDVTFPWSAGPTLDDALNASTRAAADEMLRAADVSHEVASLFAARVPRGVATSWEDARRGIDLDAVCVDRFGGGESVYPPPSTRAFEPPCDRSFGFSGMKSDDAACVAEAAASSTAFCPRKPRARAARAFADVSFVADLLEKLPGVDPTDARIACVLAAVTVDAEELQRGAGHGRRQRRGNRAAGSFPRALAPAAGRGIGAMARRELAGAGGGGGEGARANGTGGRAGGATSGETRESRGGRRN